jgi:hypothetical protein
MVDGLLVADFRLPQSDSQSETSTAFNLPPQSPVHPFRLYSVVAALLEQMTLNRNAWPPGLLKGSEGSIGSKAAKSLPEAGIQSVTLLP